MDVESLPVPPPWKRHENGGFIHDITGEYSEVHPIKRMLDERKAAQQRDMTKSQKVRSDIAEEALDDQREEEERENYLPEVRLLKEEFVEFRCLWQERNLFGNTMMFGLTIRFFESDHSCIIKFDDVDAEWNYSTLECSYGHVERYDLFLGAKIKVFGRHLSITSADGSTCEWIEKEGRKLNKRKEQLQSKIESLGVVCCVPREPPKIIRHMSRSATKPGSCNLRRLNTEILKLNEQLVDLGVVHFALK